GAAGVDPRELSNLANVTLHVGNLPGAELGFASGGEIWIDRTAAGWGWSLDDAPGRMDLATVVSHELGHVLGFEHSESGCMEVALAPGSRQVPAALTSADTVVGLAPSPSGPWVATGMTGLKAGFGARAPGVAQPDNPSSTSPSPSAIDAVLATGMRGV